MKPIAGKVYKNGDGRLVHIMGPAARDDGQEAFYSLEGDHYTPNGRMISRELSDRHALKLMVGTHSDGGRGDGWAHNLCTECYPEHQAN